MPGKSLPWGEKSEGAVGCLKVLGFLGSSYQRIIIMIVSSLYPLHLGWASFCDKPSQIGEIPKCASTRSIEGVRFDRSFLEKIHLLSTDWERLLPDTKEYLDKEAKRAEAIDLVDKKENAVLFINNLMKEATSQVLPIALKYSFYPALRPGWSILQVVDPHVGPRAASAILKALTLLGIIEKEQVLDEVLVPVVEDELPFTDVDPCGSESDSDDGESDEEKSITDERYDDGNIDGFNDDDKGESEKRKETTVVDEEVEGLKWKVNSTVYAAPTIPMAQYEKLILDGFLQAPIDIIEGTVNAYGLRNKSIIRDLVKLSKGNLLVNLNADYTNWQEHGHIDNMYWDIFREHFPAVADTLTIHFQARCMTGTPVEQTFSLAATQIKEDQTAGTNSKNMNHASSVKGFIIREMRDFKEAQSVFKKRKRKHMFRSCKNQSYYFRSLCSYGVMLSDSVRVDGKINLTTVIEMREKGKRTKKLLASYYIGNDS